jgi:hypothetical protein
MLGHFIMGQSRKLKEDMKFAKNWDEWRLDEDDIDSLTYQKKLSEAYNNYIWRLKNGYVVI